MTTNSNGYVMSERTLNRLKTMRDVDTIYCHHPNCQQPIQEGQEVVSIEGSQQRHYYHRQCYLNSFIEVTP